MLDLADALKAELLGATAKSAAAKRFAATTPFTMQRFQLLTVWGATAAVALLIAALTSLSPVGAERMALIFHGSGVTQLAARRFDAEAETQRLTEAVRGLTATDEQIRSRLAAVEQNMNDVTGSITKQIQAADTMRRAEEGPSVAATAAATASMVTPALMPKPAAVSSPATIPEAAEAATPPLPQLTPVQQTEYAVDIGGGQTIEALRSRWTAIRVSHPQFFEGLQPLVSVKEVPHANHVELRLVAGPLAEAAAAAKLCASLSLFGLFCQPTIFDGQHLAER